VASNSGDKADCYSKYESHYARGAAYYLIFVSTVSELLWWLIISYHTTCSEHDNAMQRGKHDKRPRSLPSQLTDGNDHNFPQVHFAVALAGWRHGDPSLRSRIVLSCRGDLMLSERCRSGGLGAVFTLSPAKSERAKAGVIAGVRFDSQGSWVDRRLA
jgi:hypothetical protein